MFGTLAHILWAEWRWLGRCLKPRASPGPDPLTCADLVALQARWAELEPLQTEFVDQVTQATLGGHHRYKRSEVEQLMEQGAEARSE